MDQSQDLHKWKYRLLATVFHKVISEDIEKCEDRDLFPEGRGSLWRKLDEIWTIWGEAFTDWSISANHYEKLELIGDSIVEYVLTVYFAESFKDMTHEQLTNLRDHYAENHIQGRLVTKITSTLPPKDWDQNSLNDQSLWVKGEIQELVNYRKDIYTGGLELKMQDDLYESIIAAIHYTGDSIAPGLGLVWVTAFIRKMLPVDPKNPAVDRKYARGDPKNVLEKIFTRFGYVGGAHAGIVPPIVHPGNIISSPDGSRSRAIVRVNMTRSARAFLRSTFVQNSGLSEEHKRNIMDDNDLTPNKELGLAEGHTKKMARYGACEMALETLEKRYGITHEWASRNKERYDGESLDKYRVPTPDGLTMGLYSLAAQVLMSRGYDEFYTEIDRAKSISGNRTVMRLMAKKKDGHADIMDIVDGGGKAFVTKAQLYASYLSKVPGIQRINIRNDGT